MMKKTKFAKIASFIIAGAMCVSIGALAACDTDNGDTNGPGGTGTEQGALQLNKSSVEVKVGATETVQVTSATTSAVIWTSSDPTVAMVVGSGNGNKLATITGVKEGTATIKATAVGYEATCSVTVTAAEQGGGEDDDKGEATNIPFDAGFPEGWAYWAGDSDANVTTACYYEKVGEVNLTYSAGYGRAYGVQLKYNDKYAGVVHDTSFTLVSPVNAKISVNGQETTITQGNNHIEVKGYSEHTLQVEFGYGDGYEALVSGSNLAFVLKDLVITSTAQQLATPSFTYDTTAKTVAITDTNDSAKVGSYQLGFFESATATTPKATLTVTNGGAVDVKTVPNGNYVVKIRATGVDSNFINSEWSTESVELTVNNDTTAITANTTDGWYYDTTGNSGLDNAYLDGEGKIHIEGLSQGGPVYAFQLLKNLSAPITSIKMTVRADHDGYIAFGNPAGSKQEVQITANTDVEVNITLTEAISGKLVICFGNNVSWWGNQSSTPVHLNGNIVLSGITLA